MGHARTVAYLVGQGANLHAVDKVGLEILLPAVSYFDELFLFSFVQMGRVALDVATSAEVQSILRTGVSAGRSK